MTLPIPCTGRYRTRKGVEPAAEYDAVQLHPMDLDAVAAWCGGEVDGDRGDDDHRFIRIVQGGKFWYCSPGGWVLRHEDGTFSTAPQTELDELELVL